MFKKGSVLALTLLLLTMPLPVLASTPHSEKDVIRVNDTPAATNTVQFSRNQKNSTVDTTNLASALTTWDPVLMTYDTNLDVSWLFSKSVIANSFTDVTDVYPTYDVKAKIANNLILWKNGSVKTSAGNQITGLDPTLETSCGDYTPVSGASYKGACNHQVWDASSGLRKLNTDTEEATVY